MYYVRPAIVALLVAVTVVSLGRSPVESAFPGANGKIAFMSTRDGDADIFVMNADGSNQTPLTFNTATDGRPTWSPDGNKIAFHSNITGDFEIYVMDKDGSNLMNITQTPSSHEFAPAWSADGSEIAFDANSSLDIYKINADGSGPQTPLAITGFQEIEPAWAPDNTKIVYRRGDITLFTMNPDGTGQAQLPLTLPAGVVPRSPSDWSPDAQKIAFGGDRPGQGFQVFVSNANGTGVTELTGFPGSNDRPAFSPDGTKIAFASNRDGNNEIYVMNADGSGQIRLTDNPAHDDDPDWQRQPAAAPTPTATPTPGPPAVGGIVELPSGASAPATAASASSGGDYASGVVAAVAAGTVAVAAGGWYVRRRWLR